MLLENWFLIGQMLLLPMNQSGLLEQVKLPPLRLHKRLMLKLDNGLERMFQKMLRIQLEFYMEDQLPIPMLLILLNNQILMDSLLEVHH